LPFSPHLPAAQKFYRDRYDFCRTYLLEQEAAGNDDDNFHYFVGIAAHESADWDLARGHLKTALKRAHAKLRIEHIERMLQSIS